MNERAIATKLCEAGKRAVEAHSGRQYPPQAVEQILRLHEDSEEVLLDELRFQGELIFGSFLGHQFALAVPSPLTADNIQKEVLDYLSSLLNTGAGFVPPDPHLPSIFNEVAGVLGKDGREGPFRVWFEAELGDVMVEIAATAAAIAAMLGPVQGGSVKSQASLLDFMRQAHQRFHVSQKPVQPHDLDGFLALSISDPPATGSTRQHPEEPVDLDELMTLPTVDAPATGTKRQHPEEALNAAGRRKLRRAGLQWSTT